MATEREKLKARFEAAQVPQETLIGDLVRLIPENCRGMFDEDHDISVSRLSFENMANTYGVGLATLRHITEAMESFDPRTDKELVHTRAMLIQLKTEAADMKQERTKMKEQLRRARERHELAVEERDQLRKEIVNWRNAMKGIR